MYWPFLRHKNGFFVSYTVNFFALSMLVFTLKGREMDLILTPCSNKIWKLHFNLTLPGSHEGNGGESPVFPKFHSLGQSVKMHYRNGFQQQFYPREGIWQCLEMILFVTTEEVPLAFSVEAKNAVKIPTTPTDSHRIIIWCKNANSAKSGNPVWQKCKLHLIHVNKCTSGKGPTCQCRRHRRCSFNPWVRKIPFSRKWQSTPVFLSGQRSLVS